MLFSMSLYKMLTILVFICGFISIISGDCGIISKKEWKGLTPKKVEYLCRRPVELVIIQHTATATCNNDESCMDIVRSIQNTHMDEFGWQDIGPSFLVGGNGAVYEGSGWLHIGAHTYGYNNKSIGITFIGNFNDIEPTKQALRATEDLLSCGVEKGHLGTNYKLVGHRQLIATDSPGRNLYIQIRNWRNYESDKTKIKKNCFD